jgi:hypothetical protein
MGERRSCNTGAAIDAGHVVEDHVNDDFDIMCMAGGNHCRELRTRTSLALNLVGYSLIVGPPLIAFDVFHGGADCGKRVSVRELFVGREEVSPTLNVAVAR